MASSVMEAGVQMSILNDRLTVMVEAAQVMDRLLLGHKHKLLSSTELLWASNHSFANYRGWACFEAPQWSISVLSADFGAGGFCAQANAGIVASSGILEGS